jgi:tetratricopeptide (TPR) repeat protein
MKPQVPSMGCRPWRDSASRIAISVLLAGSFGLPLSITGEARAALFEDDDARRSILDLRSKVDAQNRDLARRLDDIAARIERLEAASRGQITLANRIETLREDIERLRGELEVQTNELASTQRKLRDQYAEVDSRVKRFEPIQVTIDGQSVAVDPAERRAFDGALALFRGGEFRNALAGFDALLAQFPQTPYGTQLAYWSGSAQYALKDWKGAADSFLGLIRRFPNHPRVADAMLRLGAVLLEQGEFRLAKRTWESLIERFPNSPQATEARERLPTAVEPPPAAAIPSAAVPTSNPSAAATEAPAATTSGALAPLPTSAPGLATGTAANAAAPLPLPLSEKLPAVAPSSGQANRSASSPTGKQKR